MGTASRKPRVRSGSSGAICIRSVSSSGSTSRRRGHRRKFVLGSPFCVHRERRTENGERRTLPSLGGYRTDRPELKSSPPKLGNESRSRLDGVTLIGERRRLVAVVHHDDIAASHAVRQAWDD